uniref:Putative lipocalin n=1 Tax=Ixodes ricinus TaxID=34613 RepID=A0A6B0V3D0_IXORI
MKILTKALSFALCVFCISAKPRPLSANKKGGSREKIITISYLLDGNGFQNQDASNDSKVKHWLQDVHKEAQTLLKQQTKAEIKFEIINISLTDNELTKNLLSWTSAGSCGSESLMHAGMVLGEVKLQSTYWPLRPHVICVLTKLKLYQDDLINLLGYAMHKTLCITTVPMLLTYNLENVKETGNLLSELVINSDCNNRRMFDDQYAKRLSRPKSF